MADDKDLDRRLKQLQEILDERVTLLSTPPKARFRSRKPQASNGPGPQKNGQFTSQNAAGSLSSTQGASASRPANSMTPNRTAAVGTSSRETQAAVEFFKKGEFQAGMIMGEDMQFCPWTAVVSYPGRFIGKTNRPRARIYFDSIYEGRTWDFFYLYNPENPKNEPFLLVPTAQFVAFLDYINNCLNTALVVPKGQESKFAVVFRGAGVPKPRYLTRSSDQRTFKVDKFPQISNEDVEAYKSMERADQKKVQKMLDVFSTRHPDKVKKDQRREKDDAGMLLDAQRMLGLKTSLVPLDVVFICIDAEALERKPNPVSEVGIAILDTRDLKGTSPGPAGKDWWPLIKAYHLRVKEYSGLRNYQFVQGCPDKFTFGQSTFPPNAEVATEIMEILKPWYPGDRDLVLVGHDVSQDIKYLADLGINTQDLRFIRQIDSQVLHRSWRQMKDGRGLEAVLSELCMQYQWLHNAGNDAVYTLRAVVGVAVEQVREEELVAKGEKYVPALFTA